MKKALVSGALVLSFLMAHQSQAASIMFSTPFGPDPVASAPFSVTLPKFDSSLGTLTKVTLMLDASTSAGSIVFDNEAGIGTDVTLGIGAEVTATAPSALAAVAVPLQSGSGTVDADNDGAPDFVGTDAFSVTGGSGIDSDMAMSSAAGTLTFYTAAFLGETFDTTISSVVSTFLSSTGGFGPIAPVPGVTDGVVKVTYDFSTSVPEPTSFLLAGLAAIAGLVTYRRRSN